MSVHKPPPLHRASSVLRAVAYRGLEAADSIALMIRNSHRGNDLPLPPMRLRARIGSRGAADFVNAGRSCQEALTNAARTHLGHDGLDGLRILDFGCGCGRTLRHFAGTSVGGCDVDPEAIAWLRKHVAADRFVLSRFDPPLPWPDATFDLIYSVSVFTHLNEASQHGWLLEIARILKPGGGALLTVQSEHALSMFVEGAVGTTTSMRQRLAARGALVEAGFLFEPYELDTERAYPGVTREYGLAFHSHAYIRRVWSGPFRVRGIDTGSVDNLQDVVALSLP